MWKRFFKRTEAGIIIGCILLVILFSVLDWERWTSFTTIRNITRFTAVLGFLAIGEALLILNKEIDLSVGSVYGVVGIAFISFEPALGVPLSFVAAMLVAIGIGSLNAVLVIWGRLPSMIVTLGGLFFYRGVIFVTTGGTVNTFAREAREHGLTRLFGDNWLLGLENSFWWFVLAVIIFSFILFRTPYGNRLLAIGGQTDSAKSRGVRVGYVKASSFILCSALAGLSGIMTLSNNPQTHVTIGQDLELEAIAAAVIGGVLLTGGKGSIIGAALGTFFLVAVRSEMIALGAPPAWYTSFVGAFLILAVIINTVLQRRFASG